MDQKSESLILDWTVEGGEPFTISNFVYVPRKGIDLNKLFMLYSKKNLNAMASGITVDDIMKDLFSSVSEMISFFKIKKDFIAVPIYSPWNKILTTISVDDFVDKRVRGDRKIDIEFTGKLYEFQKEAALQWFKKGSGVIQAPPGSGKTVVGIYIASLLKKPFIIFVHTKDLMYQWINRIKKFTNLTDDDIGYVGDSTKKISDICNVVLFQGMWAYRDKLPDEIFNTPLVIVDETHRIGAPTFMNIVGKFRSRYRLGLTATPYRSDGLSFVINWMLGKRVIPMQGNVVYANVYFLKTNMGFYAPDIEYHKRLGIVRRQLSRSKERLELISRIVENFPDRTIIIALSTRMEVISLFTYLAKKDGIDVGMLHGGISKKKREEALKKRVIVATTSLIKEGLDVPALDLLIQATPFSGRTLLEQLSGRLMRPVGKKPIIIDLVDDDKGPSFLTVMAEERKNKYINAGHRFMGYYDSINMLMEEIKREEDEL